MSLRDRIFGRALATSEASKEELSATTGVPVLGLDALASTGYGPEAALILLLPLGAQGLRYFPVIIGAIVLNLLTLYFSYRQAVEVYPGGGGAYVVAQDNLGTRYGVFAAVALLVDYLLNVAVAIAAGVGAIVSVIPGLQPYILWLCLFILLTLTLVNLRGVKESGTTFIAPVILFILSMSTVLIWGAIRMVQAGGHPHAIVSPPSFPVSTSPLSLWVLLGAFANGCTAMTGIEAVSNGVPLFREPKIKNAHRTLTAVMGILTLFLIGLGLLCPAYQICAMDVQKPGYQTILSQLVLAVMGRGPFYYVALTSIFIVLTYSAQTSFADFPRVCRLLAEDGFLPPAFANRGRRLVYSDGVITLSILSGLLLIAFGGVTEKLIPLFAIGAFGAFLLSQWGMVKHWLNHRASGFQLKLTLNALGVIATGCALVIIVLTKFAEGAWITLLIVPCLAAILWAIRWHYDKVRREIVTSPALHCEDSRPLSVVIPIREWNTVTEKALRVATLISSDITAVHICAEEDNLEKLKEYWVEKVEKPLLAAGLPKPRLEILESPYRLVYEPLLEFMDKIKKEKADDQLIAILVPRLVEPHWYGYILHNQYSSGLVKRLFEKRDRRTIIVSVPWYIRKD